MSLQKCKKCKKHIGWWDVYERINGKKRFLKCSKCHEKLVFKRKKKSFLGYLLSTFAWLSFPLLLIVLVAMRKMNFLIAIDLVIIFHFACMYYIIKNYKYK